MNKAIFTKFLPCTNTRGSRIVASDMDRNRKVANYEHALHFEERHGFAAFMLATSLGWHGFYVSGGGKNGETVWVCVSQDDRWPHAAGMADHARAAHDQPYGFERRDWFYIPNPNAGKHGAGEFSAQATTWKGLEE